MNEYAERDIEAQGEYYERHIFAMTGEKLHSKSAIAAELAHRDIVIAELLEALEAIIGACDACEGRDDLSLTDVFTEEMEQAARAAIAKAKGEPS